MKIVSFFKIINNVKKFGHIDNKFFEPHKENYKHHPSKKIVIIAIINSVVNKQWNTIFYDPFEN